MKELYADVYSPDRQVVEGTAMEVERFFCFIFYTAFPFFVSKGTANGEKCMEWIKSSLFDGDDGLGKTLRVRIDLHEKFVFIFFPTVFFFFWNCFEGALA